MPEPVSELRGPLLGDLGVVASPSAGQGLALDELGRVSASLLKDYPNDATKFLSGAGTWIVPSAFTKNSQTVGITNGSATGSATVTHGLGSTPTAVILTFGSDPVLGTASGAATPIECYVTAVGATQFTINLHCSTGVNQTNNTGSTVNYTIYWVAL